MAKIQNTDNTKRGQRCGATELSFIAGRMQNGTASGRQFGSFLEEVQRILLPYSPAEHLSIYPKELKAMSTQKSAHQMFITALLVTIKI